MFTDKSRYKGLPEYEVTDRKGRKVKVVPVPEGTRNAILGYHLLKQGQRLDHLAATYLNDPAGFWRIGQANEVMLPEALSETSEIAIPHKF
jgi:hypothetical protein